MWTIRLLLRIELLSEQGMLQSLISSIYRMEEISKVLEYKSENQTKGFCTMIFLHGRKIGEGIGNTLMDSEQSAAENAWKFCTTHHF